MSTGATHLRPFVLLTGATGVVGGLVLAHLLRCDLPVAVIVRGNRRQSAADRVESLMQRLEERYLRLFVRPVVLSGDLCVPGLGLSRIDSQWLAGNCGSVIHSAANLMFRPASEHPENEPYRTNVEGTRHLLDLLMSARITEWHFVSTAYISGLRSGRILEAELNVGQKFANDYECSKSISEQLLTDQTRENGNLSLTVYRPSIVVDLHPTTSMQSDQTINTSFSMFQVLCQRFGLPERGEWTQLLGFRGDERKNIVSVDWVATMVAQIYRRPALHGRTYHLTNSNGFAVSELETGFREAWQSSGEKPAPQRRETNASFHQQAAPFVAAFQPYFRDDPTFDRANTIRAMEVCGEPDAPSLTLEQIRDICLRQMNVALPGNTTVGEQFVWNEIAAANNSDSASFPGIGDSGTEDGRDAYTEDSVLTGLTLSGPGGGQWLIEDLPNSLRVRVAAASLAPVRWIATSNTMNQLIEGQFSVSDAIDSGLLMIEVDPADASSSVPLPFALSTIEQFSQLIARLQCQRSGSRGLKSEVANVG